jgi:purine-nucleoside phosphorylase
MIKGLPEIAVVLGSGLSVAFEDIKGINIPYKRIPRFPIPKATGHPGSILIARLGGREILFFKGRLHCYEGYSSAQAALPARIAKGLGAKILIVTNAAGGLNPRFRPGDIMAIKDHINLMGENPLRGRPNFIDMGRVYEVERLKKAARRVGITLRQGVYAAVPGPSYETPAEVRMLRRLGADAVGMSTVPEVIQAVALDLHVMGISVITNSAGKKTTHDAVLKTSCRASATLRDLIENI